MAEAKIAARTPTACAGCYGQYPERVHVDFSSAIEGGPVNDNPRAPRVEWVVLCENCVRRAFALLPKIADGREKLGRQAAALQAQLAEAKAYAASLEEALARRPDAEAAPTAPAPDEARENLERQVKQLTERAEAAENLVASLEDALKHEPAAEPAREPRQPRPRRTGGAAKTSGRAPQRRNRYAREAA
ncbi:MAG TPA: hypothetical protein VFT50_09330 [Baekduia sp.]|nr:hypothetical protein [Baekduia sp.]